MPKSFYFFNHYFISIPSENAEYHILNSKVEKFSNKKKETWTYKKQYLCPMCYKKFKSNLKAYDKINYYPIFNCESHVHQVAQLPNISIQTTITFFIIVSFISYFYINISIVYFIFNCIFLFIYNNIYYVCNIEYCYNENHLY